MSPQIAFGLQVLKNGSVAFGDCEIFITLAALVLVGDRWEKLDEQRIDEEYCEHRPWRVSPRWESLFGRELRPAYGPWRPYLVAGHHYLETTPAV